MDTLFRDIRYAFRRILHSPGFTLVALLSIGLGVGANAAIYTIIDTVLFSKPPYADVDRLVEVYPSDDGHVGLGALSYPEIHDIEKGTERVFSGIASTSIVPVQENFEGGSRTLIAEVVSGNYFDVLGLPPLHGRSFLPEEDRTLDSHPVIVLSQSYWQDRFGGDRGAIGQSLRLNGRDYTIIGIAAERVPSLIPGLKSQLWAPSMMVNDLEGSTSDLHQNRGRHNLFAKGRMRPGVTLSEVQGALDAVRDQTHQEHPDDYPDSWGLTAVPTRDVGIHPLLDRVMFPAAGVLMAVVGMVLLIACVNLASFLLARASRRKKEIALRLALGARRWTLIRQLLTETLILSLLGGVVGVLIATWCLSWFQSLPLPTPLPLSLDFIPDAGVLLFALLISVAAGLFFGLIPALQTSRPKLAPTLKEEAIAGQLPRRLTLRNMLIVAQVTVSFLLLAGAGLFLRSLQAASDVDPGFGQEPTALVFMNLHSRKYDEQRARQFYEQLVDEVSSWPEVKAAGLVDNLALGATSFNSMRIRVPGVEPPAGVDGFDIDRVVVDSGYFDAAGVSLVAGRNFGPQDVGDQPVTIISQAMARKFWSELDAVGKVFRDSDDRQLRVIGVASDTNVRRIGEPPLPYIYTPVSQDSRHFMRVIARTQSNPQALAERIAHKAREKDPDVMLLSINTMAEHLGIMLFPFRFGGMLLSIFGALAVLLASIGLYGVVSFWVAGRVRDVGIRMSLGARRAQVVQLVLREGLGLVLVGSVAGLVLSLATAPLVGSLLFGIEPLDWPAFSVVFLLMLAVGLLASLLPALRASRIDPIRALKTP